MIHGDACFAYFNKIWGIPARRSGLMLLQTDLLTALMNLLSKGKGARMLRAFKKFVLATAPEPVLSLLKALRSRPEYSDENLVNMIESTIGSEAYFVKVGANDGRKYDPLCELITSRSEWRGLFIEPVGFAFAKLLSNYAYGRARFVFARVAVAETTGVRPFFYVVEKAREDYPQLPDWYDQLGSFDRNHILWLLGSMIEPYIACENVPCDTLRNILAAHDVVRVDLFHIDTEGYDYRVLRQFDFDRFRPRVVLYEHAHLTKTERKNATNLLKGCGYRICCGRFDTLAVLRKRNFPVLFQLFGKKADVCI
jgi:FkbM family methyltransferase